MFTKLQIKNFKVWEDTGHLRLAPLTVLFGTNSSGKSSLGHLLLALKQTVTSSDTKRTLFLGDRNSLIDLGTFEDAIHTHQEDRQLEFDLAWSLPQPITLPGFTLDEPQSGDELALHVVIEAPHGQPRVRSMAYQLNLKDLVLLDAKLTRQENGKYKLESDTHPFTRKQMRAWPLPAPLKFYRFPSETSMYYQDVDILDDLALETEKQFRRFFHLGPLREHPQRNYEWSGDNPEDVGARGEKVISALLAAQTRKLSRGYKLRSDPFPVFIAKWLNELGLINSFEVKPIAKGRKEYEVLIQVWSGGSPVRITDVGFGVSQVLPAIVQAFYAPPHSTVLMEQPEIHLHPQVQANLADLFLTAIQAREDGADRNVQLIIESHSEHFLNRLMRRVAEEKVKPEQIAIYFCESLASGRAKITPLQVDLYGNIANWPENFFGDEMADIAGRTAAAAERMQKPST